MIELYDLKETYSIVVHAVNSLPKLKKALASGLLSQTLKERIMLAVTSVNGCAMCSYAHTQMALEAGLSNEEIKQMLTGDHSGIPDDEAAAILFAQHYADSRGKVSRHAWDRLIELIGKEKAISVLHAVRVIMAGNAYGIPFGSLKGRLTRHQEQIDSRSTIRYELIMLLSLIFYVPPALLQGCICTHDTGIL